MLERTPAFEAYLKDLKKNTLPKQSKTGRLETALATDELSEKDDDQSEVDAAA